MEIRNFPKNGGGVRAFQRKNGSFPQMIELLENIFPAKAKKNILKTRTKSVYRLSNRKGDCIENDLEIASKS